MAAGWVACLSAVVLLFVLEFAVNIYGSVLTKNIGHPQHAIQKRGTRCYGELGCFGTGGVFSHRTYRPINLLPVSRATIGTTFYLHTRRTHRTIRGQILRTGNKRRLIRSDFRPDRPTKLIIHGFTEDRLRDWVKTMKEELLERDDYNVIVVDWSEGASIPYTQATANSRVVGAEIALFLHFLQNRTTASPGDFHLIGFSLGAHVAGYAGERVPGLGRITGLDPADPYFQGMPAEVRLDPTDAQFVDVLHTDAAHIANVMLLNGGLGLEQPVGDLDFYPNGGKQQPGCEQPIIQGFRRDGILGSGTRILRVLQRTFDRGLAPKRLMENVFEILQDDETRRLVACNHQRALDLFIESINSRCPFMAFPCDNFQDFKEGQCLTCGDEGQDCGYMGFSADQRQPAAGSANRSLYLSTAANRPYCAYHYGIEVKLENISRPAVEGRLWVKLIGTQRSSPPTSFSDEDKGLEAGETYSVLAVTSRQLGVLHQVELWWDCEGPWWNPLHWCWARSATVTWNHVQILSGETQQQMMFCADRLETAPEEKVTMNLC